MQVILLDSIKRLGTLGDTVKVKGGYARNFLLPQKKAVIANDENRAYFESKRAELEANLAASLAKAKARADKIEGFELTIPAKASEEGKLFGSIGTRELAEAFTAAGFEIDKQEVALPEGVLRQVGEYDFQIKFHSDVTTHLQVKIVSEE